MTETQMITDVADYFAKGCGRCAKFATPDCVTRTWAEGLSRLRAICLAADLVETAKWGHPCYMFADRNIAIIGAFQSDFRLSFFNAALLKDTHGLLERQGPHTRTPDMIRFQANDQVSAMETAIRDYLDQAKIAAAAGLRPPKDESEPDLPEELVRALDADPILSEAFAALTRGRRKSYAIAIGGAKQSETRIRRIAKFRDKIIAGKGAMER